MKKHWTFALLVAACAIRSAPAYAAGFAINEIGAREQGMANAVTAVADRPSAIAFNPAGLAQQKGLLFDVSLSIVMPDFGFDTNVPGTGEPIRANADQDTFLIPSLYVGYRVHDRVAVGLGVYSPFGLAVNWQRTLEGGVPFWGRSTSQEIDVKSVFINPTVALKLNDRVYLGAGFVIAQGAVTLQRAVTLSNNPSDDIDVNLSGDDIGFGATAGLLVRLVPDRLNVGINYRSAVSMTFSGAAAFSRGGSGDDVPAALRQQLIDGDVEAPLTLPHTITFGVAAFPLPELIVGASVDVITWSTFKNLEINFVDTPDLSTSARRDWTNTFAFRLGAEYKALGDNLPLRLGFIFDQSPVPDDTVGPELPDADRFVIALGVGYVWRGIHADFGYQFLVTPSQETGENVAVVGSRDAKAHIMSFGLGYGLDI